MLGPKRWTGSNDNPTNRIGLDHVHAAADDRTYLSHAEILPDARGHSSGFPHQIGREVPPEPIRSASTGITPELMPRAPRTEQNDTGQVDSSEGLTSAAREPPTG